MIDDDGKVITDQKKQPSHMMEYFNNIGNKLDEFVPIGGDPMNHVHEEVLNSMFLIHTIRSHPPTSGCCNLFWLRVPTLCFLVCHPGMLGFKKK